MVNVLSHFFKMPIVRDDIYLVNSNLDYIEPCAVRLQVFKIQKTNAGRKKVASLISQVTENINKVLKEFPKTQKIFNIILDTLSYKLIADLLEEEKDPIELIELKEIYARLNSTLDRCQDPACLLEAIVVKKNKIFGGGRL